MNLANITNKWAELTPHRDALIDTDSGERMSFATLDEQVTQLANALLSAGLGKGDRVGILSKNSIDYFVVYYACARGGFIAQPLNWRLAGEELGRIVADGDPAVFVSAAEFQASRDQLQQANNLNTMRQILSHETWETQ